MSSGPMTIREAFSRASSLLHARGVEDAKTDAELLLQHAMGWTRSQLFLRWSDEAPEDRLEAFRRLVERRADGEPVQYLLGEQGFFRLVLRVSPAVLIPRPETELLVEAALRESRAMAPDSFGGRTPLAADIGTGSGAIAIAFAVHAPGWEAAAVDISEAALAIAAENAARQGVAERVRLMRGDLLEPLLAEGLAPDLLLSNPPYIESGVLPTLQREVREHEPWTALDGGKDGLEFYRRILVQIGKLARPPRVAGFECGAGQARTVRDWMKETGYWREAAIIRDLAGIERHVLASGLA